MPRQQTLAATLDWSYALLTEPERMLFRRLAAFAGGWDVEATEAVGTGDGIEREVGAPRQMILNRGSCP